jgi:hypothetical protein
MYIESMYLPTILNHNEENPPNSHFLNDSVAGRAMTSSATAELVSCLLMRCGVLGRIFGFNHKIMINV